MKSKRTHIGGSKRKAHLHSGKVCSYRISYELSLLPPETTVLALSFCYFSIPSSFISCSLRPLNSRRCVSLEQTPFNVSEHAYDARGTNAASSTSAANHDPGSSAASHGSGISTAGYGSGASAAGHGSGVSTTDDDAIESAHANACL